MRKRMHFCRQIMRLKINGQINRIPLKNYTTSYAEDTTKILKYKKTAPVLLELFFYTYIFGFLA